MMQYTPGPWVTALNYIFSPNKGGGEVIAYTRHEDRAREAANARLIAAAPAMLEALENIILCCDANDSASLANAVEDARAAITKAKEP